MTLERSVVMGKYGSGTVYRRGRIWHVQYYVRGKRITESSHSETKRDAVQLLQRRLARNHAKPVNAEAPTFKLAQERLLADYEQKRRKSNPEERLRHLRPVFGRMDLASIRPVNLMGYVDSRIAAGAAHATVNRELACLKRMMNLMRELELMDSVPVFPRLEEADPRKGFVEEDELQAILKYLPDHVKPIALFGYVTGWRRGEILSRDFAHVSAQSVRLEPGETKNGQGREFPLNARLMAVVDSQRERAAGRIVRPLFFYDSGKRVKDFRGAWSKATRLAGLGDVLFHDLRRSAARNMVQSGIPESVAMKLTGHRTRSVFERYAITDGPQLQREAAKLDAWYERQPERMVAL